MAAPRSGQPPTGATADRRLKLGLGLALLACASLVLPAPPAAAAAGSHLTRYPYLTDVLTNVATVSWGTDRWAGSGRLTWGKVGSESCTAHSAVATRTAIMVGSTPEYQWRARIRRLDPDTRYCYRAFLGPAAAEVELLGGDSSPILTTNPAAGTDAPFSFAVIGDWGYSTAAGNPQQAAIIRHLASSGARFALSTGDIGYQDGSQTNYGDLFQTGTDTSAVFGPDHWPVAGPTIPMYPALGNHGLNSAFQMLWPQALAASSSAGSYSVRNYCCLNGTRSANYPSDWYAFDVGSARFYVLDAAWSNDNVGTTGLYENDFDYHWQHSSPEYQWLEHDLATHSAQVKFAVFHFPLYSANDSESSDPYLQGANGLEGLLSRNGVDIAFNGHAHIYERNVANGAGGLISYVTGGGGATPEPVSSCGDVAGVAGYAIGWSEAAGKGSACGAAHKPISIDQVYHYLRVSVDGRRVTVTPVDAAGHSFDQRTYDFPADGAQRKRANRG